MARQNKRRASGNRRSSLSKRARRLDENLEVSQLIHEKETNSNAMP